MAAATPFPFFETLPFPALPNPLEPLNALNDAGRKVIQRIISQFQQEDRLFGPLEQAVAAAVIVTLAIQQPATLDLRPDTGETTNKTVTNSTQARGDEPQPGPQLLAEALGSTAILVVSLLLLAGFVLLPPTVLYNLKDSWDIFWPPWKDRIVSPPTHDLDKRNTVDPRSHSERTPSRPAMDNPAKPSSKAKESSEEGSRLRTRTESSPKTIKSDEHDSQSKASRSHETRKPITADREDIIVDRIKTQATSAGTHAQDDSDKKPKKAQETKRKPAEDHRTKDALVNSKTEPLVKPPAHDAVKIRKHPSSPEDDKLTPSERSRLIKQGEPKSSRPKGVEAEPTPRDSSSPSKSSKKSVSRESDIDSGLEDDPLMAGDYKPLRSALKKTKKKPRQKKNIHHNYFMTMRGYRPALIPFPHGLHPKPSEPRHTLWFDNVPKVADHLMAPPPVPKAPEEDEEEQEKVVTKTVIDEKAESDCGPTGSSSRAEKKTTVVEEKIPLSKTDKVEGGKAKGKEADKVGKDARAEAIDLSAKSKAASDGRAKTEKSESEIARERKSAGTKSQSSDTKKEEIIEQLKRSIPEADQDKPKKAQVDLKDPAAGPSPEEGIEPASDRSLFVTQNVLCCLLYLVDQRLAIILLAFFVYMYCLKTGRLSSFKPERNLDNSKAGSRSTTKREEGVQDEGRPQTSPSRDGSSAEQTGVRFPANVQDATPKEKTTHGLTKLKDLTEEQKERYLKALASRKAKQSGS